jgi:hypothetical protein
VALWRFNGPKRQGFRATAKTQEMANGQPDTEGKAGTEKGKKEKYLSRIGREGSQIRSRVFHNVGSAKVKQSHTDSIHLS